MSTLINLTPHVVHVYDESGVELAVLPASGDVARVKSKRVRVGQVDGLPVYAVVYGEVTGLPSDLSCPHCGLVNCLYFGGMGSCECAEDPIPAPRYIVSALVRCAVPHRKDVFSPGELKRNNEGQPIGCIGLDGNE